jgi:hypothetical protein
VTDPFPYPAPSAASTFPRPGVYTTYTAPGLDTPVVFNWNLTVERQFSSDWLVRLAYVGSHSYHQRRSFEYDPAVYSPGVTTSTTDARRLFAPAFGTMTAYSDNGVARYNSFQASLQHRLSRGFTFQFNYTLSKSIDDLASNVLPWTNPFFDQMIKGPSDFDHHHRIVTSYVWDIPSGKISGLAKLALGGWQLTGVQQWQTGPPLTITSGKDNSLTGLGNDRAIATGQSMAQPGGDPLFAWFNQAAFAINPIGTAGTLGRGILHGPNVFSFDMGAFKRIPLKTERIKLQFRAEFFNIFNHPVFNNPSTSLSSASFGRITSTLANAGSSQGDITNGGPRVIQLALKLAF